MWSFRSCARSRKDVLTIADDYQTFSYLVVQTLEEWSNGGSSSCFLNDRELNQDLVVLRGIATLGRAGFASWLIGSAWTQTVQAEDCLWLFLLCGRATKALCGYSCLLLGPNLLIYRLSRLGRWSLMPHWLTCPKSTKFSSFYISWYYSDASINRLLKTLCFIESKDVSVFLSLILKCLQLAECSWAWS